MTPTEHPSPDPARGDAAGIDGSTFEQLFRECARDVHGYAIALLGDRAGAEDVTALAFERLYGARGRLDRTRGTPRAWLFSIARNAALDELRRRRRRHGAEALERTELGPLGSAGRLDAAQTRQTDPAEAIEQAERRATVHAALLELPLREREVVLLKFHGQLTNGELARVLGISESNAGTRVHRALSTLRATCAGLRHEEVA